MADEIQAVEDAAPEAAPEVTEDGNFIEEVIDTVVETATDAFDAIVEELAELSEQTKTEMAMGRATLEKYLGI